MEKLLVPQLAVFDLVDKTIFQYDGILCHCIQDVRNFVMKHYHEDGLRWANRLCGRPDHRTSIAQDRLKHEYNKSYPTH